VWQSSRCSRDCVQDLFVMVSFILHLGNVSFDDEEGVAVIMSNDTLNVIDAVCTYSPCYLTAEFCLCSTAVVC